MHRGVNKIRVDRLTIKERVLGREMGRIEMDKTSIMAAYDIKDGNVAFYEYGSSRLFEAELIIGGRRTRVSGPEEYSQHMQTTDIQWLDTLIDQNKEETM